MAYDVDVHGATAKVRRPFAVFFFTVITLGVYGAVWYYRVNRELRDFGAAYGDQELAESKPRNSLLAVTLGSLVYVPFYVSLFGFVGRVRKAERIGGGRFTSGWLVGILTVTGILGLAVLPYVQSDLNELWRRYGGPPPEPEQPTRRARLWAWLTRGEPRELRPPPGWLFKPVVGWGFFALAIGLVLTPVWPLSLVLAYGLALQIYEDCRAQRFSSFWFPSFAATLGPVGPTVFLAYIASRGENLRAEPADAPPTPDEHRLTAHLPPAGWYPDPLREAASRYWDGQRWTQEARG